jgi:hypothetical protein
MIIFSFRKEKLKSSENSMWVARGERGMILGTWKNHIDGLTHFRNKNWYYEHENENCLEE